MSDFNPPTTTLFSYADAAASAVASVTYDATHGYSLAKTDGGAASTERAIFQGKAVAAGTWDATMKFDFSPVVNNEFARFGLGITNSTSHKLTFVGMNMQGGTPELTVMEYTNMGTFNTAPFSQGVIGEIPEWFRISWDGTNYTFKVSFDNSITWVTLATLSAASTFTADHIGAVVETFGTLTIHPTLVALYYHDPDF
jgi:hypothetical protein